MAGRLKISDIKIKTEALENRMSRLERQLLLSRVTTLVAIDVLAWWMSSVSQGYVLSEPWERIDQNGRKAPVDKTAKYILMAGLTLSLATLVVGTAINKAKNVLVKIKNRACSSSD